MKRTVSLFEFMPYGAPELLAAARPNLARALALSSLLPVAAFFALLPLVPMLRSIPLPEIVEPPSYDIIPAPPRYVPPDPTPAPPSSSPASDAGVPVPVPEVESPPSVEPAPPAAGPASDAIGTPGSAAPQPGTTAGIEREPVRGVYEYVEELPRAVVEFKPEYPDIPRQAGVEGLVIVHALIGRDGRVIRVELDEKKNVPLLNEAALDAAQRWVFTPALSNGEPVTVWYAIPFKFVLR